MAKKKFNDEDGVWRTIGGRRVFIRTGQSLSDAMKESGKFEKTSNVKREQYRKVNTELQKTELSKELAREIYGKGISDEVAERYGKDLMQLQEGTVTSNLQDWEWDGKKTNPEWSKEALENKLTYFQKGYNASKEEGDLHNPSILEGKHIAGKENTQVKNNKIPRDFEKGYGKFKVKTNANDNLDDRFEITKDEYGDYHAKNLRTGETYATFAEHLRNGNVFEFESQEKKKTGNDYLPKASKVEKAQVGKSYNLYDSLDDYEIYEQADKLANSTNDYQLRDEINKRLDRIDRANRRGSGYGKKPTNELREILKENEAKDKIFADAKAGQNETGFVQQTDMYGGTREYTNADLKRMENAGTKPMEHSYTGGGWEGTKYDSKLSTKEIAKNIIDYSKENFPDVKLSRKTDYNGIDLYVMSSDKDMYITDKEIDSLTNKQLVDLTNNYGNSMFFDRWAKDNVPSYTTQHTFSADDVRRYMKEDLKTMRERSSNNVTGNEYFLSDYGKKVISGLNKEMNSYNYDDSDGQVDYFDTNFYGYVHIGKWNQPYNSSKSDINNLYQQYKNEHKGSKISLEEFKKWFK